MLNAKSGEKFLSRPKWNEFWRFWWPGGHGFQKVAIFTPMGTSVREFTLIKPFCVKIGRGVWPPGRLRKKSQKVTEPPIGKTCMSPLTQGLNYRSACDWGHDLDLSRSRDVIDHVTIRFRIQGFLLVLHWNQVPISKRFRDIWLQIYRGHDLDLGCQLTRHTANSSHVTIWPFDELTVTS